MEFCSKFGYNYGFEGSDEEEISDDDNNSRKMCQIRKADTNIIAIKFDDLMLPADTANNGELIVCERCGAVMSYLSGKNIEKIFDKLLWQCEFCFLQNDVSEKLKDVEKLPKANNVSYLIDAKKKQDMLQKLEDDFKNTNYLVFCIDVSGSMCTTIPVKRESIEIKLPSRNSSTSDLDDDEKLSIRSNSTSSFLQFSDEASDDSNVVDDNDFIVNATSSDVELMSEEERKLDDEIKFIQRKMQEIKDGENSELKNQLTRQLDDLNLRKEMLEEQKAFFEESIRQQDDKRVQDLQAQFSLYSLDDQNESVIENNEPTISRLSGVKTACIDSLDHLRQNEPNVPVALVTFSDHVKYYGDKNEPLLVINNNKDLCDVEKLNNIARNVKETVKPVSDSYSNLATIIEKLVAEGGTALGPSLQFSISLASKRPGSKIILCTDGCANVGIGDIENSDSKKAEKFYNQLADFAKAKGVVVNVITVEGTDCKLSLLGHVADRTNGSMFIVNPLNLGIKFKSIIQNRIIATNVQAKLIVNHKYIYIRDEEYEKNEAESLQSKNIHSKTALEKLKKSVVTKDVGNVTIDTEITFEYGIKRQIPKNTEQLNEACFQVQITYETPDGTKAMRVYTQLQEFTKSREEAENSLISKELLFSNASQKISRHAINSNIAYAKRRAKAQHKFFTQHKIDLPDCYSQTMSVIKNIKETKKANDFDDIEAQMLFSHAKASRAFFRSETLLEED